MNFIPTGICIAVLTGALGIFSAAAVNEIFQPASTGKRLGQSVAEKIQALPAVQHYSAPFLSGRRLALEDLKDGRLKVASNAKENERERIFRDILLKEYRIETLFFGWTDNRELSKQSDELVDGYNQTVSRVIEQRFGWDVLKNVRARAIAAANGEQEETNKQIFQSQRRFFYSNQ